MSYDAKNAMCLMSPTALGVAHSGEYPYAILVIGLYIGTSSLKYSTIYRYVECYGSLP